MKTLNLVIWVAALFLAGCAKAPDPKTFLDAWNAAVRQKDAKGVWGMFDQESQNRISAAWQKSQARAATDKDFQRLWTAMNSSLDLSKPPTELAQGALVRQLGGALDPNLGIKAEGGATMLVGRDKSTPLHLEDGQWRISVGTAGFVIPEGVPVTMDYAWPIPEATPVAATGKSLGAFRPIDSTGQDVGPIVERAFFEMENGVRRALREAPDAAQPAVTVTQTEKDSKGGDISKMNGDELDAVLMENRLVSDKLVGFQVNIDLNGTTTADVKAGYVLIGQRLAELAHQPPAYADQAARLMFYFEGVILDAGPGNTIYDVEFGVGTDGSLTPTDWSYDRETRSTKKQVLPRLGFVRSP